LRRERLGHRNAVCWGARLTDRDNFARLRAAILDDPALQRQLRVITDWETFAAQAIAAAKERGIELTEDEITEERRNQQLDWLARFA